jgi:hypothetical protein
MRRWLHRTPFLLATLWCAATAGLWIRSYSAHNTVGRLWASDGDGWWSENSAQLSSSDGVVQLKWAARIKQKDSGESGNHRVWSQRGFYYELAPFEPLSAETTERTIDVYDHRSALPLPDGRLKPLGGNGGVTVPHWLLLLPGIAVAAATFGPARANPRPRRWRRALFHTAALPLLLLAGTVALWATSRRVGYQWSYHRQSSDGTVADQRQTIALIGQDVLLVAMTRNLQVVPPLVAGKPGPTSGSIRFFSQPLPPVPTFVVKTAPTHEYLGFSYTPGRNARPNGGETTRVVTAPLWAFPLATMPFVAGSAWLIHRARRTARRLRRGECARCGYDLRATPDGCPECGARPPHPLAAPQAPI